MTSKRPDNIMCNNTDPLEICINIIEQNNKQIKMRNIIYLNLAGIIFTTTHPNTDLQPIDNASCTKSMIKNQPDNKLNKQHDTQNKNEIDQMTNVSSPEKRNKDNQIPDESSPKDEDTNILRDIHDSYYDTHLLQEERKYLKDEIFLNLKHLYERNVSDTELLNEISRIKFNTYYTIFQVEINHLTTKNTIEHKICIPNLIKYMKYCTHFDKEKFKNDIEDREELLKWLMNDIEYKKARTDILIKCRAARHHSINLLRGLSNERSKIQIAKICKEKNIKSISNGSDNRMSLNNTIKRLKYPQNILNKVSEATDADKIKNILRKADIDMSDKMIFSNSNLLDDDELILGNDINVSNNSEDTVFVFLKFIWACVYAGLISHYSDTDNYKYIYWCLFAHTLLLSISVFYQTKNIYPSFELYEHISKENYCARSLCAFIYFILILLGIYVKGVIQKIIDKP